jgi:threonine/homoserine/homoserine lactone efflux protein
VHDDGGQVAVLIVAGLVLSPLALAVMAGLAVLCSRARRWARGRRWASDLDIRKGRAGW